MPETNVHRETTTFGGARLAAPEHVFAAWRDRVECGPRRGCATGPAFGRSAAAHALDAGKLRADLADRPGRLGAGDARPAAAQPANERERSEVRRPVR